MQNVGCTSLLGLGIIIAIIYSAIQSAPWLLIIVAVVAILLFALLQRNKDNTQSNYLKNLTIKGNKIQALSESGFPGEADFELAPGEHFVFRAEGMQLAEYRSGGSTYQGGNVGFSVPVVGRIRANVGSSRGQLVKNPDELTIIDTGVATFTSQRVVFAGERQTREWTFAKLLSISAGDNGDSVTLGSSGKNATSVLVQPNFLEIGPGILIGIAKDYHDKGQAAAAEAARGYAQQVCDAVAGATK